MAHYTQRVSYLLVIVITLLFIHACTGLVGKGDKLYDAGLYKEAAEFYEKALAKNPDSVEARVGLDRARRKIIDEGLIEVRMLRLSSNQAGATLKLESILDNQLEWRIPLEGAIAFTQQEEMKYAISWIISEANTLANSTFPDKFLWFKYNYDQIIANAQITNLLENHQEKLSPLGKNKCLKLSKQVHGQHFFLKEFVFQYCALYGEHPTLTTDSVDYSRFRDINHHSNVRYYTRHHNSLSRDISNLIANYRNEFKNSLWYSANGQKNLLLQSSGQLDYKRRVQSLRKEIVYTVENKEKQKTEQKDKKPKEPITKKYSYLTNQYNENLLIDITLTAEIENELTMENITHREHNQTESYDASFPEAGLHPRSPSFIKVGAIYHKKIKQMLANFNTQLNNRWNGIYCSYTGQDKAFSSEALMRCAITNKSNAKVNAWFKQEFGIDYQQMKELTSP